MDLIKNLPYRYKFYSFATMHDAVSFLNKKEIKMEDIIFFDNYKNNKMYLVYREYYNDEEES